MVRMWVKLKSDVCRVCECYKAGIVVIDVICGYDCMYILAALVLVCVDVMVMSYAWAMT